MNPSLLLSRIATDPKDRPYEAKLMHEVYDKTLEYIDDRRKGKVSSFITPWQGLNAAGINGLEWNSLLTVGARPGAGKTMIVSQLLREARLLNPRQEFNILEFQFEMGAKQYGSREFAALTKMDYSAVLSSHQSLDDYGFKEMQKIREEARAMAEAGIFRMQIHKPLSYAGIEDAVRKYYDQLGGKPLIVTIDHSWLIKGAGGQNNKFDILYQTAEMLMQLKNQLPVIFIMLTQLNRDIDSDSRKEPGRLANYPNSSDIFGGDALMQASDMVIALNNPYKAGIMSYGPKQYVCKEDDIFMHLLKIRNAKLGEGILFMKAQFDRGRLAETHEPAASNPNGTGSRLRTPPPRSNGHLNNIPSAVIGDEL